MRSRLALPLRPTAILFLSVAVLACNPGGPTGPSVPANDIYAASLGVNIAAMTKTSDDLYIQDMVVGTGTLATNGKLLGVTYSGYLVNGSKFDSNVGKPVIFFTLGAHEVITGWELGFPGMKVGGKRRLVIGSSYAYGAAGREGIPRHSTLVFDVELISVQ